MHVSVQKYFHKSKYKSRLSIPLAPVLGSTESQESCELWKRRAGKRLTRGKIEFYFGQRREMEKSETSNKKMKFQEEIVELKTKSERLIPADNKMYYLRNRIS